MPSEVEIANVALTLLGEKRITSLDDDTKPARETKALWSVNRDALLAQHNWSFAMFRQSLPALAAVPDFDWDLQYNLPAASLRVVRIGDFYAGVDLSDYRTGQHSMFTIEGRKILTNLGAPLPFRGVKRESDTTVWSAPFSKTFAAYMAYDLAEALTQSDVKRGRAETAFRREISLAIRANAIELPPQKLPDDEWILSRR